MSIVTICTIRQLTRFHRRKKGWVIATDWTRINAPGGCGRSLSRASSDLSPLLQYQQSKKGQCGICGDRVGDRKPRAHEIGGKYYKGIIVRNYRQGQVTMRHFFIEARAEYSLHYR